MPTSIDILSEKLELCASKDRFRLASKIANLERRARENKPFDIALGKLEKSIIESSEWVQKRLVSIPTISYPDQLPVAEHADELRQVIADHQVVIVAGETGSGKTTQLPKLCLSMGIGARGLIGHTQPRRVAARSVASRIASELNSALGSIVGYQVRFSDNSSPNSLIKLMTDGILLSEIQRDRYLSKYECIIIDEAHERSLNIDFLLGYLKELLPLRPDLKVIVTSATIDVERFSEHFDHAPVIEVSGRTYPVEIQYHPLEDDFDTLTEALVHHVQEILGQPPASQNAPDILVFFSGEREIRDAALALRRAQLKNVELLPLYSRLSNADQDRVFRTGRGRRVVLSTNVAETSLTVPGIGYVIDTGTARVSRYSVRTKVQHLPVEAISQASANQRAGRCGRIAPGLCLRLYSEEDYLSRPEYTAPEILRTNLAAVILQMQYAKLGDIRDFPFVEPPQEKQIRDGFQLLEELSFIDSDGRVTRAAQDVRNLPVDPRFARMLWQASKNQCLTELITLVSYMSVQDPRDRPPDKQEQSDQKHRQFADAESDFVSILNLWQAYEDQRQELSNRELQRWCKGNFLSPMRMREWRDIHRQLSLAAKDKGWKQNVKPASYKSVHRAVISGLITQIGIQQEDKEFLGARNRLFRVFPGSFLAKKPPKWIVAAQLIDTKRLYAHQVAKIDPEWLLGLAKHLIQTDYYEPYYDVRRGEVMARQRFSLYGLVLSDRQKASYKSIDPATCREIFIRECLANWKYRQKAAFYQFNQSVAEELKELEDRTRSRGIQFDEEQLFQFYAELIPADVVDKHSFERWRQDAERDQPKILFLDKEALVAESQKEKLQEFPETLVSDGINYKLSYRFEPGHRADGVTMLVPIDALHQVPEFLAEWLVPGLFQDKLILMLKALPKHFRRNLVPIPTYVEKMLPHMTPNNVPLASEICRQLKRLAGLDVPVNSFNDLSLEPFYLMNFRLLDDSGRTLTESRSLSELKQQYRGEAESVIQSVNESVKEYPDDTRWSFNDLPASLNVQRGKNQIRLWPALVDRAEVVGYELFSDETLANYSHRRGTTRLLLLNCHQAVKYLKKELFRGQELQIHALRAPSKETLSEDLLISVCNDIFDEFLKTANMPRTPTEFDALVGFTKHRITEQALEKERRCLRLAEKLRHIKKLIEGLNASQHPAVVDIELQISRLIYPNFMQATSYSAFSSLERYLKGIEIRVEKLKGQLGRDLSQLETVRSYEQTLEKFRQNLAPEWQSQISELADFRWLIEEFRVSVFSQPLKTGTSVSEKRLQKLIDAIETRINSLHLM